jgi:integrase
MENHNVKLIVKNRTNKAGLSKIEVQVMKYQYDGKVKMERRYVDTTVWINPQNWNQKNGKISSKEIDHTTKQQQINLAYSSVLQFVESNGQEFPNLEWLNIDCLQEFFPKVQVKRKALADYIIDYYDHRVDQKTKKGTTKEFKTLQNRIEAFDAHKKKKTYLEDINILWSNSFESYCRNIKEYSDGTIGKSYTILYTVLNYYYEIRDEMQISLTDKFKSKLFKRGGKSENKANPLTMPQLLQLISHEFNEKHLIFTKKMILIQCHTGIRYDDIKRLRPVNFETEGFLIFKPIKTEHHKKCEVEQPLNAYSKALFEEVGYNTSIFKLQNQPYNRNIETIFDKMRDKYPDLKYGVYTSHNFRDTFISNCVQAGINWKSILKWVGQTSYAIMDRYIKLTPEFQHSEMQKLYKFMVVDGKIMYYKEVQ